MKKVGTNRGMILCFGCFDGIFWGIMASFGSYIIAMGLSRGYTQSMVSTMVAGYLISAFAGQFFWTSMCDRLRTNKKIFLIGVSLTAVVQLLLYFSQSPLMFGVLYIILGFTLQPMGSVLDAWMLKSLGGDIKAYAPARGGGSIGYAIIILLMGQLIARLGYQIMLICASTFAAATLAIAFVMPDVSFSDAGPKTKITYKTTLCVLKQGSYIRMLAVLFFLGMAIAPVNTFKISILEAVGGDVSTQGWDGFFSCVVQFVVFEAGVLLARIPAVARLMGGTVMMSISIFVTANAPSCKYVIAATMLVGAIFGIVMPAGRELILQTVDSSYHTTAIGLMDGCYSFLGGTVAMLYAGTLAEGFGLHTMLLVCGCVSLVPLALLIWQARTRKNISIGQ